MYIIQLIYHISHSAVVTVHCRKVFIRLRRCPRHQEPQLLQVFEARVVVERIRGQVEALATRAAWCGIAMGDSNGKNMRKTMGKQWEYHGNIMDSGDLTPRNGNIKWEYKN